MASPFPGMDPYLEGYLWPDVHHRLANEMARRLAPQLRPRYVARLEVYVVEDENPEVEIGIMYPDVQVVEVREARPLYQAMPAGAGKIVAPLTLPLMEPVPVQVATVEVRDAVGNELVTSIEILSSVNKRAPGLEKYRQKRRRLRRANIHLLEIDLLRRGERPLQHAGLPQSAYLISLTRAGVPQIELWPLDLQDELPVVPVPLRSPDPDASLDLGAGLQQVYEEAAYDLSLDYAQSPPPPAPDSAASEWIRQLLAGRP